jgi:hypothetical protein
MCVLKKIIGRIKALHCPQIKCEKMYLWIWKVMTLLFKTFVATNFIQKSIFENRSLSRGLEENCMYTKSVFL